MKNILIVEDEPITAQDIKEQLETSGYTSVIVSSGEKAIQQAKKDTPDLVLMDIVLKEGIDGIEAAETIQSFDIPVVFLTAHADEKTVKKAKATEPYGYIVKPVNSKELFAIIETVLYRHEMKIKGQKREKWFSATFASIKDAVITTDTDGVITFMNTAAETLTGHPYSAGTLLHDIVPYQSIKEPLVTQAIQEGAVQGTLILYPEETHIHTEYSATPITYNKTVLGVVIVFRDVTEQIHAEEKLKRAEKKFRDLFENVSDAIFIHDTTGHFLEVNKTACERLHYTREELLHMTPEDIDSAEYAVQVQSRITELLEKGHLFFETVHVTKEGEEIPIELSSKIIEYEGEKAVLSVARDISERKKAEEELRRIAWLISKSIYPESAQRERDYQQPYGDVTVLNTSRVILDSMGHDALAEIVRSYLDLLETSAAVYEKNGDYAQGIFASGWCRFLDQASRDLCQTADNAKALQCGKWFCHESCWNASKLSIEMGQPVDVACPGGLRLYAVPIWAGDDIIGSINFGYGDPPKDFETLERIAQKYKVDVEQLKTLSNAYESRPDFMVELAKNSLVTSAQLIGTLVKSKMVEDELRKSKEKYQDLVENIDDVIYTVDKKGIVTYISPAIKLLTGYFPEEIVGHHFKGFFNKEDLPELNKSFKNILAGDTDTNEYRIVDLDDTTHWVRISSRPVHAGRKVAGIQGVLADITLLKRAETQLKSLFEASRLLNSTMDMEELYRFISDSIQNLVGFENLIIFLTSEDQTYVYPVYASDSVKDIVQGLVFQYGEGVIGTCMKNKTCHLLKSQTDESIVPGVNSGICVPLVIEGKCIGALHISHSARNAYNQEDITVLQPLSEVISSTVRNLQLHHEIKAFNVKLEERVKEKARRTEIILYTKQKLQTEQNWKEGLTSITKSVTKLGFDQCAIFLVNPQRKTLDFQFGEGVQLPDPGTSVSLKDTEYYGVKCITQKKPIYVKDSKAKKVKGKQISFENMQSAQSFVWIPIIVQGEAFAAIAAGNTQKMVTEEDIKDLEMLAGMCSAFIDRTRILTESIAEKQLETECKYWLDPAQCYIITEKRPRISFDVFVDLVTHGIPGFVITREYPDKLRKKYNLVKTPTLWLTMTKTANALSPEDLPKMNYIVGNFTRKSEDSVVLLDGLEYLITQTTFREVLRYLQELKDMVTMNNSRLVIPLHTGTLSPEEYTFLEREFVILGPDHFS
ncbi:MAG: PAS domain S-box protein [Candidatus Methanofastidiosia archaeon]|jgi:PAS domain S-box-containing protein